MEAAGAAERQEATPWERAAQTRWGRYITEVEKAALLHAHAMVPRPTTALDIGCEGGRWSRVLSKLGWRLICTDVEQRVLDVCQWRIPTATCILVRQDQTELPCETESIGLMLCVEVAQVMQADWLIYEAYRVLQQGGVMVGVFQNRASWRGVIKHAVASIRGDNFDWYRLSYPAWRKRLRAQGFTLVREEGCYWFPFPRTSDSRLVSVATPIERWLGLHKLPSLSPWIVFIARKTCQSTPTDD